MKRLKARLKFYVVQYLVKNLLKAITIENILTHDETDVRVWYYKGRALTKTEMQTLRDEARSFRTSLFWRLAKNDVAFMASQLMFDKQQSNEDMQFGKAMLYDLSILDEFINRVAK